MQGSHHCIERSAECDCTICGEYLFTSRETVVFMPCGHPIHWKCYNQYNISYACNIIKSNGPPRADRCPICLLPLINSEDHSTSPVMETKSSDRADIQTLNDDIQSSKRELQQPYRWTGSQAVVSMDPAKSLESFLKTPTFSVRISSLSDLDQSVLLAGAGDLMQKSWVNNHQMDDLDHSIALYEKSLLVTPYACSDRSVRLSKLGSALRQRFEWTGFMNDLNRAIENAEQSIESAPEGHSNQGYYIDSLGTALHRRFEQTGSIDDFDRAIKLNEQATMLTKVDDHNHAIYLSNFGLALQRRHTRTGSMSDLERAIKTIEQAMELNPENSPDRAICRSNLGLVFLTRFESTGLMSDLNTAIEISKQAVALVPTKHPNHIYSLANLGRALHRRFELMNSMDDLEHAMRVGEQVVGLTPNNSPARASRLSSLAYMLQSLFERTGLIDDINRVVDMTEQILSMTPQTHPERAGRLNNLGSALRNRFQRTGSAEDLDRAIKTSEEAVSLLPDDHPVHATCLGTLGSTLQSRFERTGSSDDLSRAIEVKEKVVLLTSYDHRDLPARLVSLGNALQRRFERTGSTDDLNRAVEMNERAVTLIPSNHHYRTLCLNSLGTSLHCRFERMGSMSDLNMAIKMNQEALALTPEKRDPNRPMYLNNLGNAFRTRFERTGSMNDLERAIEMMEQAVLVATDHPNRKGCLDSLGVALQRRSQQTGSLDDLNRATKVTAQVVESSPSDHPISALYLNNLGNAFQSRFYQTESMDDLERAIEVREQVVAMIATDQPFRRAICLNNLGSALQDRFQQTGSTADLDHATKQLEEAVALTSSDHPNRADCLKNLGDALQKRFEQTRSLSDLEHAIKLYEQAVLCDTAPPSIRIRAAISSSSLLIGRDRVHANSLLRQAVSLLPLLSTRALKPQEQQHRISEFYNLTARAVSLSLDCGETPYCALQLLEIGRGVLTNLQLEMRSDISVLRVSYPDLAERFDFIRNLLDTPQTGIVKSQSDHQDDSEQRYLLSNDLDTLIAHIRRLERFERFLLGPSESEVKALPGSGSIVIFNVSDIRSDAIIIDRDRIRSLRLPSLQYSEVRLYAKRLLKAVHTCMKAHEAKSELTKVLEWLWDVAVMPILEALGFTQTPSKNAQWPRVWWIGSGLLNLFPIHAAGYHDTGAGETTIDRVISSYTPTVKALIYARKREAKTGTLKGQNVMLIGMPQTPQKTDLPYVEKELRTLQDLFKRSPFITTTVAQNPTRSEVLSALRDHQIVHLSCHGYSDEDPSRSTLLLNDWDTTPLTVSDLHSLNLPSSQFAYLSACHTASSSGLRLLDESINLSSAIQLAGYPSVVGTLWPVMDRESVGISKDVYEWLFNEETLDVGRSAEGLHRAVRALREKTRSVPQFNRKVPSDPFVWAPFIHLGV